MIPREYGNDIVGRDRAGWPRQPEVRIIIVTDGGKFCWFLRRVFHESPGTFTNAFIALTSTLVAHFIPACAHTFSPLFLCFVGGPDSRSTRGYYIVKPFNYLGKLLRGIFGPVLTSVHGGTRSRSGGCTPRPPLFIPAKPTALLLSFRSLRQPGRRCLLFPRKRAS